MDTMPSRLDSRLLNGSVPNGLDARGDNLLLRESDHRCSNDLQLVVSLLELQARRAVSPSARQALKDATMRVGILARARGAIHRGGELSLATALRQICEALQSQAEPRDIFVSLKVTQEVTGLSSKQVSTLALVVNELATNAIKHGYEEGKGGLIEIRLSGSADQDVIIIVDDDGLPFPDPQYAAADGLGMALTRGLMASIGGSITMPSSGTKAFKLQLPIKSICAE